MRPAVAARASACRSCCKGGTEGNTAFPLWEKDVFIHSVPINAKSPTGKRPQFCFYTGETDSIPQLQEARAEFRVGRNLHCNLRDPERRNWGEMHMFKINKNFDSGSCGIFAKTCHRGSNVLILCCQNRSNCPATFLVCAWHAVQGPAAGASCCCPKLRDRTQCSASCSRCRSAARRAP